MPLLSKRLKLFPLATRVISTKNENRLTIACCDLTELANQHGTPLYVYDQYTMDEALRRYRQFTGGEVLG